MNKFYFTYGSDSTQPFIGGWTEITAPDIETACNIFTALHPCKTNNILNCCSIYNEDEFHKTTMFERGNFDNYCHEKITITIKQCNPKEKQ